MTPEGKVKRAVAKLLKQHGVYYFMPVQTGYGAPALDYIGCHRGRFFSIETKAPGKKKLTDRQKAIAEIITKNGGAVFVISTPGELQVLDAWLLLT